MKKVDVAVHQIRNGIPVNPEGVDEFIVSSLHIYIHISIIVDALH